jgi:glycosyltransferase involved in cell wall biosynthesis
MKIVYVIDSLANQGGVERIVLNKTEYMTKHFGYDISIITCYQNDEMPNSFPVPDGVKQIRLGIPFYSQYHYRYPYRLVVKNRLARQLQYAIETTIQRIDPDILVFVKSDVFFHVKCRAKVVFEGHEPRPFTFSNYGLSRGTVTGWYMKYYRRQFFRQVERQADVVVALTQGDAFEWRKVKRVEVIPNFTKMPIVSISDTMTKRAIAVGRFEWVKGYDQLIDAWKIVSEKHPDWHLDLFGGGKLEQELKQQQERLGLQDYLSINPGTSTINEEYAKSSLFVASSHFEGFPLVLLEAMQVGLPCVAFDCRFGPSAVIDDGVNGFLVPEGDVAGLAEKICRLIEDEKMRQRFSQAALEKSKQFAVDVVMARWKKLFESLL